MESGNTLVGFDSVLSRIISHKLRALDYMPEIQFYGESGLNPFSGLVVIPLTPISCYLNWAIQYSEVLFNPIIHLDISQLNIQME